MSDGWIAIRLSYGGGSFGWTGRVVDEPASEDKDPRGEQ